MDINAFVIVPYTDNYQSLYKRVITPTLQSFGIRVCRADEIQSGERISQKISEMISGSDIIICDISEFNPNVFFEIGLARAQNKNIIMLSNVSTSIPSDFDGMSVLKYDTVNRNWEEILSSSIKNIIVQGGFSNRVYEFEKDSSLDIYIKYKTLTLSEITSFLNNLNSIHQSFLSLTSPIYYSQENEIPFRHNLFVERAYTGNSVNFSFKEGWLPEFKYEEGDLNVKVPKNLGIPALIGIALLSSANEIINLNNNYLDSQIKEIELKSKTFDYNKKVEDNNRSIKLRSNKAIKELHNSVNISNVEINNIQIISNE